MCFQGSHDEILLASANGFRSPSWLVLSSRPWNTNLVDRLANRLDRTVKSITVPARLTPEVVAKIEPQWIFVPHWSHWIPDAIWSEWPTVIFHMTDLHIWGGSPLQIYPARSPKHDADCPALRGRTRYR